MSDTNANFFLYARKSSDVEDKQVLSIDAQLNELRAFAEREGIHVVAELIEKQSAKIPGRPIYDAMVERIEAGEADGILAWHPDRLARNSIDGGRIIYLLDTGKIKTLKFPTFRFEPDPQGKFMLSIMFGQSKYYVDSLSENTKRGLREKVRQGDCPSRAPFGYLNDHRTNAPLDFELKALDATHPYLLGRGFTAETIKHFGLGFCSRGYLKERVAIPLHDMAGTLIGYAGRVVDDSLITDDNPRYRLPGERERDGKLFQFRKTLFLYNGFRVKEPVDDLIVVEGFTGVWWLVQNGRPNVVATMGSDCSERQAELIVSLVKSDGRVWIGPDGDKAGERYAQTLLSIISPHRFIRWVKMDEGKQPTDLSEEQLKTCFKM